MAVVSHRHNEHGDYATNSLFITDTEREMRELIGSLILEEEDWKSELYTGSLWILTCEFDMDSHLPAPPWDRDDDDEVYYDEYDRLNDMGEWVGQFYSWLGSMSDEVAEAYLCDWLCYMTVEGAIVGENVRKLETQPLLDWYVAGWGGRYVRKAG